MAAAAPAQCNDRQSGNHAALVTPCAAFAGRYCDRRNHTGRRKRGKFTVCTTCSNHTTTLLGFGGPAAINLPSIGRPRQAVPFLYPTRAETPPINWPNAAVVTAGTDAALPFPPWPGFLTPMCTHCSEMCLAEAWYRGGLDVVNPLGGGAGVVNPNGVFNPPGTLPFTEEADKCRPDYPNSTCTCRHVMGIIPPAPAVLGPPPRANDLFCYQHRKEAWDKLIEQKEANEKWLYDVALSKNGRLIAASAAVKAQRVRNGTYRACRCGRETATRTVGGTVMAAPPMPDVWLCMGYDPAVSNAKGGQTDLEQM